MDAYRRKKEGRKKEGRKLAFRAVRVSYGVQQ
jgi:hypothetical protein